MRSNILWAITRDVSVYSRLKNKIVIDKNTNCWNWVGAKFKDGYGLFTLDGRHVGVHRVMFSIFNNYIPEKLCVCHKCDNPLCCNPEHLFLGTLNDNVQDCINKGRRNIPKGEKHYKTNLKNVDIIEIRKDTRSPKLIAKDYSVSVPTIYDIKTKHTWKSVKEIL